MKPSLRFSLACALAGGVPGCPALAQPATPVAATVAPARFTMAQALDAAWARSLESAEASGRQRQAEAQQRVAGSWLAGAPTLEWSQREGRGAAAAGSRETEIGLALPLWRLGQAQQNAQAAQAESDWAAAAERAARLRLAAQLREQAGRLRLAEADARQAARQRQLLEELGGDVERRVQAGDLAPADAMAARAEMLSARTLEAEAQQSLATQRSAWALLSGAPTLPEPEPIAAGEDAALEQHAEAQLAEAAVQRSRQRVKEVQAQRGSPPELGLGWRQERPGLGQAQQHSLALSLRLPLGQDPHSQPRLAAALAEQDLALLQQQRLRPQLEAELALARGQLSAVTLQLEAESERARLLSERARLLKKSFQAGESALPELLRALSAAAQAEAGAARQQAALAQARARLQQALGQLP
ncbi:outer membrane protein TolC [Paucibacter oligotrophus]|uniref:Outer membrane protein TolC n=1 Tax=Roseateles oligotrophus TaxID=1769250 RepID=A0A840LGT1_9BURK|nr:outer membrane protein TolC [Roseateles oligotrophus]